MSFANVAETTAATTENAGSRRPTLADLCRDVVVSHLERYPAAAFDILDEAEWCVLFPCHVSACLSISQIFDGMLSPAKGVHHKVKTRENQTKDRTTHCPCGHGQVLEIC